MIHLQALVLERHFNIRSRVFFWVLFLAAAFTVSVSMSVGLVVSLPNDGVQLRVNSVSLQIQSLLFRVVNAFTWYPKVEAIRASGTISKQKQQMDNWVVCFADSFLHQRHLPEFLLKVCQSITHFSLVMHKKLLACILKYSSQLVLICVLECMWGEILDRVVFCDF
jgi:hypothetical protein